MIATIAGCRCSSCRPQVRTLRAMRVERKCCVATWGKLVKMRRSCDVEVEEGVRDNSGNRSHSWYSLKLMAELRACEDLGPTNPAERRRLTCGVPRL